jgi:TRAP-type C4-dicarboxylate transport system permease small subunit
LRVPKTDDEEAAFIRPVTLSRRGLSWVSRIMGRIAGWVFILCAFFITTDVLLRNFVGISSQAAIELTGYMLAFGTAWALGYALIERCHIRIDLLVDKLPARVRYVLHTVSLGMLAVFVGFLAKGATDLVAESWLFDATDISILRTPLVIPQGIWAFGICMFFLLIVAMLIESVLLVATGKGAEVEQRLRSRSYDEEAAEALEAVGAADASRTTKTSS